MTTLVFFSGSSQVGKTELFNLFPAVHADGREIVKVKMDFTSIRESLGNPSWEDLEKDTKLLYEQQSQGLAIYKDRILQCITEFERKIYLFERHPNDIYGYMQAFSRYSAFKDDDSLSYCEQFERDYAETLEVIEETKTQIIYRPIDDSFPYDRRNNTRPSEAIRYSQDFVLAGIYSSMINYDLVCPVDISVNQGQEEVDRLLGLL